MAKKIVRKTKSAVAKLAKVPRTPKAKAKIKLAMEHFKEGEMHSGKKTGPVVTNPKQAIAISLDMARREGKKRKKK